MLGLVSRVLLIKESALIREKEKKMYTNTDGMSIYTQEDVDKMNENARNFVDSEVKRANDALRNRAIEFFKGEVRGGSMVKDDALSIFNGLADSIGWDLINSLATLYTVSVSYNGDEIGVFEDIEAENEDGAVEQVESNIEVSDLDIEYDISYDGQSHRAYATISSYDYDLSNDFSYEATEQQ